MDLKTKVGPLPLWAWIGLMAGIGYIAWRRAHSSEAVEGVEEGWFPTQGIPAEGAGEGAGGGGGVSGVEEFLQRGQEAAESRAIAHEEAVEDRTVAREEAAEGRAFNLEERRFALEEWMAKHTGLTPRKPGAKKPSKGHQKGKGAGKGKSGSGAKKGHESGNGNAGQKHHASHGNHQPGHTAKTDHRPPHPPRTRIGPAKVAAAAPAASASRAPARAPARPPARRRRR